MKLVQVGALAAAGALAVSACSGGGSGKTASTTTPSSSLDTGIISPHLPALPKFTGKPKGVIKDVTVTSCSTQAGVVKAEGTATNSTGQAKDIAVIISWVTSTSDVVARGVATLSKVAPGASQDWAVRATLAKGYTVSCVPTAYSGTLASDG